jgi:hypothetical protein
MRRRETILHVETLFERESDAALTRTEILTVFSFRAMRVQGAKK